MSLLTPSSIAIIGASATPGKVGHDILKNILTQGFKGSVYPVNPKHEAILDTKSYASVKDIGNTVDLAIVVVPAAFVPGILKECAEKSIKDIIIISAGFGEVGTEVGDALEKNVKDISAQHNLNVVGPNCLGIIRPSINMNASFALSIPPSGSIALLSQSGAMAVGMMDSAMEAGLGFSLVASIGNTAVLNECDFLEMAADDDETKVIGLYLENITDGTRFLSAASQITKPIVLLKSGVSMQGKEAAASHTGALAGNDAAIDALCAQAGIHRAETSEELFDMLEALSLEPALASNRIAIITNAGGPGILATDAAVKAGLTLPKLSPAQEDILKTALPAAASTSNPIDVIGDADVTRFISALDAVGNDPDIDGVCIILTPQVMTPCAEVADAIITWKKSHSLMPVVTSFIGHQSIHAEKLTLQKAGIPCFETPERAAFALSSLQNKEGQKSSIFTPNKERAAAAQELLSEYKGLIPEGAVQALFELYNIPVPQQKVAVSEDEAVAIAAEIGYPVIAKISSPHILHKTDIGGIRAHLITEADVRNAWKEIQANVAEHRPDAEVRGILIQQFRTAGEEFIVGSVRDNSFGHLVMAGLGGIYTELLEDTSFRIAPITKDEGYRMLNELTSWELLLGMRGKGQLDIVNLAKLTSIVSELVMECPQIKDIDLNPVFVTTNGILVADAKVVIG
jgi:acetyl coenzyme A synthetase (ADP forming)-like protein